jgi:hypothetical protein
MRDSQSHWRRLARQRRRHHGGHGGRPKFGERGAAVEARAAGDIWCGCACGARRRVWERGRVKG